ncbi:hypothetical protein VTH06DRAFT_3106 [Thermothelomyces fergusii]
MAEALLAEFFAQLSLLRALDLEAGNALLTLNPSRSPQLSDDKRRKRLFLLSSAHHQKLAASYYPANNNTTQQRPSRFVGMSFQSGDTVRIRGSSVVYKVVAVNNNLVTILISNPQPDGQFLPFGPTALQTVDESRLERADDVS